MKRWRRPKQVFSCQEQRGSAWDFERSKPRLHWDYQLQEWRSGKTGYIDDCRLCAKEYLVRRSENMCRACGNILWDLQREYRNLQAVAAARLAMAIRKRELLHPTAHDCVDCGEPAACYDHRDSTKPLDVDPVCRSCNSKRGHSINMPEHLKRPRKKSFVPHPELKRLVSEKLAEIAERP